MVIPETIEDVESLLASGAYVSDRSLATAVFLALKLNRPLFLEGEAGVGKTEVANVLANTLDRRFLRLQCYEGLDVASAVYEWNFARQMIGIRLAEVSGSVAREDLVEDVFSRRFLVATVVTRAGSAR